MRFLALLLFMLPDLVFAQMGMGFGFPMLPSTAVRVLPSEKAASDIETANARKLNVDLKDSDARLAAIEAERANLMTQMSTLETILKDQNSDGKDKKVATDGLKELRKQLAENGKERRSAISSHNKICSSQLQAEDFFAVAEKDQKKYSQVGFKCAEGERMVAVKGSQHDFKPCYKGLDLQMGNSWGANGASGGMGGLGMISGMGMMAGCGSPMGPAAKPSGQVACQNTETKKVTASALFTEQNMFGEKLMVLSNHTRYNIQNGHVKGWTTLASGEEIQKVEFDGENMVTTMKVKDQVLSQCKTKVGMNGAEYWDTGKMNFGNYMPASSKGSEGAR